MKEQSFKTKFGNNSQELFSRLKRIKLNIINLEILCKLASGAITIWLHIDGQNCCA